MPDNGRCLGRLFGRFRHLTTGAAKRFAAPVCFALSPRRVSYPLGAGVALAVALGDRFHQEREAPPRAHPRRAGPTPRGPATAERGGLPVPSGGSGVPGQEHLAGSHPAASHGCGRHRGGVPARLPAQGLRLQRPPRQRGGDRLPGQASERQDLRLQATRRPSSPIGASTTFGAPTGRTPTSGRATCGWCRRPWATPVLP
jgi:hypothetical protein